MALKLADMGHLSAPLPVHLRWVAALEEEFFRQGDAEKACLLPVSPLFDRTKPGVTKSQVWCTCVLVNRLQTMNCLLAWCNPHNSLDDCDIIHTIIYNLHNSFL